MTISSPIEDREEEEGWEATSTHDSVSLVSRDRCGVGLPFRRAGNKPSLR